MTTTQTTSRKSASKTKTAPPPLPPEDFAPYSEEELTELARRIHEAPAARRAIVLTQTGPGAALAAKAEKADSVIRPLLAVWGPEGLAPALLGPQPNVPAPTPLDAKRAEDAQTKRKTTRSRAKRSAA